MKRKSKETSMCPWALPIWTYTGLSTTSFISFVIIPYPAFLCQYLA